MERMAAEIGAALEEIDTPALVVDLDAFDRNLAKMATFARDTGVRLRPHAKTHKCPMVAQKQIAAGAVGQCCQKVGEAEALVRGGVRDVLVTNQVVAPAKLRRLAALAADATVALCFDSVEQVRVASAAARELGVELGGLVEVDVGMRRCGVRPGDAVSELARQVADAPGLRFEGLQAYHGTAQHLPSAAERSRAIAEAAGELRRAIDGLSRAGLSCNVVTGAGTGTFRHEATSGVWNELQPGSYLFMDVDYARIGGDDGPRYTEFEHSLFVLSTVISVALADHAVVDAGLKSYSAERGVPWVHGLAGVEVTRVADEHATLRLGDGARRLAIGERVMLIPGHCDPTINLHDWFVGIRKGRVEALWPITARGASS